MKWYQQTVSAKCILPTDNMSEDGLDGDELNKQICIMVSENSWKVSKLRISWVFQPGPSTSHRFKLSYL
ncbi:unnamed protein product [Caenorhabditis nigoni]